MMPLSYQAHSLRCHQREKQLCSVTQSVSVSVRQLELNNVDLIGIYLDSKSGVIMATEQTITFGAKGSGAHEMWVR